jgi:hypothetical protein
MRINSRAWTGPFNEIPWSMIAARFEEMATKHPEFRHMADIVASVRSCGGEQRLAGLTSMHDLIVTTRPIPEPPIEEVVVYSPSSGRVGSGAFVIEHRSSTGHDDRIARPSTEAVALFWRFMIEKFGVEPVPPEASPEVSPDR